MIPATATITVSYDCPACEGKGYTHYLQCGFPGCCRKYTTEADLRLLEVGHADPYQELMPCWHGWSWLEDIHPCSECEGAKVITKCITLAKLGRMIMALMEGDGR